MNPCGSSGEQGGGEGWGTSDDWEHSSGVVCQFQGFGGNFQTPARPEWDQWDNTMLFSHNQTAAASTHHHGHIELEQKPNIFACTPATDLRHYSSCGAFPSSIFPQNTFMNELNQTEAVPHNFRKFESMLMQNIPKTQLLPSGMVSGCFPGLAATNAMSTDTREAFNQRHRMFDILDFEQRNVGDFFKSCEEAYSGVDVQARIGLNLAMGGRTYFSAEDSAVARLAKRQRFNSPAHIHMPKCQAEGCTADLSRAKHYHRRHKVCEFHSKAACVVANGQTQRFCQQCSRFHALSEFDEAKRSCRKRLAEHNRRRRKPQPSTISYQNSTAQSLTLKSEETNIVIQSSKPNVSAADTAPMLLHFKKNGSPSASTEELKNHRSSALIDFPLNSFSSVPKTDEKPVLKRSFLAGSHNSITQASDSQHRMFSAVNSFTSSTSLMDDAARNYLSIHNLEQHGHDRMFQHYLQVIPVSEPNLSLSTLTGPKGMEMAASGSGLRQPPTKYLYSEEDNIVAATNWLKPESGLLPDFPHESLRSTSNSLEWMSGGMSCQAQRQTKRQQLGPISNYLGLNRSEDYIEGHCNILSLSETSPCSKDGRNMEAAVALELQALQSHVDAEDMMGSQPLKLLDHHESVRPFGSCVYD